MERRKTPEQGVFFYLSRGVTESTGRIMETLTLDKIRKDDFYVEKNYGNDDGNGNDVWLHWMCRRED